MRAKKKDGLSAYGFATRIGKSVTYARSVLGGYLPREGAEEVIASLAEYLGVQPRELYLVPKTPQRKTA